MAESLVADGALASESQGQGQGPGPDQSLKQGQGEDAQPAPQPQPPVTSTEAEAEEKKRAAAAQEEEALSRALSPPADLAAPTTPLPSPHAAISPSPEQQEADGRSVYVGNVDYSTTPDELQLLFQSCGPILRVTIVCDKYSGHPKGYCYIEFAEAAAVARAVAMSEVTTFKGRQLRVTPKRTNVPGLAAHPHRRPGLASPYYARRPPRRGPYVMRGRGPPRGYHPYAAPE